MRGKHELNPNILGLMNLISIVAVARGGGKTVRFNELFIVPIAFLCYYLVFMSASDNVSSDYVMATSATSLFFTASDVILLRRFQPELRMIGQKKPSTEMSFVERLKWALQLQLTPRGINWAHEPTEHLAPRPTETSRTRFIISKLLSAAYYFIYFDILSIIIRTNPCFGTGGPSFTEFGWIWRTTIWLHPCLVYAWLSMTYDLASIVGVGLGIWEPRDWPRLFGDVRDAYTIRKCWGRVWHQLLRKFLTGHMNFFARALHLPRGTFSTYFKLFGSFFISGLTHYGAEYTLLQNWSGKAMWFFPLQAAAITFEDAVIGIAKRLGFRENFFFRFVGYVWVFVWFAYCLPPWLDPTFHAGTTDMGVNVSLIMGIWKGDWTPKRQ
ncbi:hypothetical protein BDN70DRAFT_874161 [Pholiota conissans]|uniref:Wax synthase domain-containing protein n=1 Tax=Pholiota conissans TaxID=109636 RepID=A0A9P6CXM8_9AGAR|nr:hypothetical protein BDN70DRAFT_874161 [Pholiota conissans]